MKLALQLVGILALAVLCVLMGEMAWTTHRIRPKLEVTISNIDRTVIIVGVAATHFEKASAVWEASSKQQAEETTAAMRSISSTAVAYGDLARKTNLSLNTQIFPALMATINSQDSQLTETQTQLRTTLSQFSRDSSATLAQSKSFLDQLSQDASDPAIHSTLVNVDATATNIAGTSKDVKDVADKFRNDYLKPQKFAWELLKSLAGMGGSMAQMVK